MKTPTTQDLLNEYIMVEHASDNPDGSPKVDDDARAPLDGEDGPAAALRLLKLAHERGAFAKPGELATAERELAETRRVLEEFLGRDRDPARPPSEVARDVVAAAQAMAAR